MAIDKNGLIEKLNTIEGLTSDERSALLGLLRSHKKYGLVWEDKPEDVEERLRSELPVLIEDKDKAILSDNPDAPNHILIEGDNLEALTSLAYTHEGKIDVIYIDPPYNTGNKDFVYNDSYVDGEDTFRHSKWLSFMSRRLKLAKQLLSEKGVIFISIDDNEISNLKLLCDEIFIGGFLQKIIVESNPRGSQSSKYFANVHEYLLCYSVKRNPDVVFGLKKSEENLSEYNKVDDKGRYRLLGLRQRGGAWRRSQRPMLFYPIYVNPEDNSVSLTKDLYHTEEVIPCRPSGEEGRWTWSKEKFEKEKHLLQGVKVNEGSEREKWDICRKDYLANDNGEEKASKVKSIWDEKDINYQNGGTEVKEIIGDGLFSYPKPLFLLKKIISSTSSFANTYLDFFAGSGTTLHAVMQMNDEDNGSRKCILVTNNENGICENVTYERNKRVINGYTKPNGDEVEGLTDNNLRYYRTSFVGRSRATKKMRQLMSLATDMLCIKEDLYTEQEQFGELSTHPKVMRYFTKGDKSMLIIYYEQAIAEIVEQIEKLSLAKPIKVYVFSPSEDPWEEDFEFVNDKVELCALPAAIYNTYKRILPKKKDERIDIDINAKESEQPKGESTLFDLFEEGGEQ